MKIKISTWTCPIIILIPPTALILIDGLVGMQIVGAGRITLDDGVVAYAARAEIWCEKLQLVAHVKAHTARSKLSTKIWFRCWALKIALHNWALILFCNLYRNNDTFFFRVNKNLSNWETAHSRHKQRVMDVVTVCLWVTFIEVFW